MTAFSLAAGASIDILTQKELDDSLGRANDAAARAFVRGIKWMRLPQLRGIPSASAVTIGQQGDSAGPASGYAWTIRRLAVSGLTAGSTPDVIAFYRNGTTTEPVWQVTGTLPFVTFGRLELVLLGGDTLVAGNVGTLAATGTITLSGELVEVPQEMLGKLA